jgi:hypothetical protein
MATIGNVSLEVGRIGNFMEFARVWFRVSFSGGERNLNMPFLIYAELYGRDDAVGRRLSHEMRGHRAGEIGRAKVRPDGNAFVDVEIRREWEIGSHEGGIEDYRALVTACPHL